jgi:hypothetical protein
MASYSSSTTLSGSPPPAPLGPRRRVKPPTLYGSRLVVFHTTIHRSRLRHYREECLTYSSSRSVHRRSLLLLWWTMNSIVNRVLVIIAPSHEHYLWCLDGMMMMMMSRSTTTATQLLTRTHFKQLGVAFIINRHSIRLRVVVVAVAFLSFQGINRHGDFLWFDRELWVRTNLGTRILKVGACRSSAATASSQSRGPAQAGASPKQ